MRFEFLTGTKQASPTAELMLAALVDAARKSGAQVIESLGHYQGLGDVLVLYGVGAPDRELARRLHVDSGRRVVMWDLGYFERTKIVGHLRFSIDRDHPQHLLDLAPNTSTRLDLLDISLREDFKPDGPILLVGLGTKSRVYLKDDAWEARKLADLRKRFPNRRVIYRPKPGHPPLRLGIELDAASPIEVLLKGASLVVCRHSNVAVDGVIAGVPFESEDGAVCWLKGKPYTRENRIEFLRRLAWFQWRVREAGEAWQFIVSILNKMRVQ